MFLFRMTFGNRLRHTYISLYFPAQTFQMLQSFPQIILFSLRVLFTEVKYFPTTACRTHFWRSKF